MLTFPHLTYQLKMFIAILQKITIQMSFLRRPPSKLAAKIVNWPCSLQFDKNLNLTCLPCFAIHPFEASVTTAHLQYLPKNASASSGSDVGSPLQIQATDEHQAHNLDSTLSLEKMWMNIFFSLWIHQSLVYPYLDTLTYDCSKTHPITSLASSSLAKQRSMLPVSKRLMSFDLESRTICMYPINQSKIRWCLQSWTQLSNSFWVRRAISLVKMLTDLKTGQI